MASLYIVVPSHIRSAENISGDAKLIYCEIEQWNEELSGELNSKALINFYKFSPQKLNKVIQELIAQDYLDWEQYKHLSVIPEV